jgi:hypothetical protein
VLLGGLQAVPLTGLLDGQNIELQPSRLIDHPPPPQ